MTLPPADQASALEGGKVGKLPLGLRSGA